MRPSVGSSPIQCDFMPKVQKPPLPKRSAKKSLFQGFTKTEASVNNIVINSKVTRKLHDASSDSPHSVNSSATPVRRLLSVGFPSAIFRFIISIVVDSSNSCSSGSIPKIGKEIRKIFPSIANLYSSTSVILKFFVVFVRASSPHGLPAYVGFSVFTSPVVSMLGSGFYYFFKPQTSTTLSMAESEFGVFYDCLLTAFASAKASASPFIRFGGGDNSQSCNFGSYWDSFRGSHNVVSAMLCLAVGKRLQSLPTAPNLHYHRFTFN